MPTIGIDPSQRHTGIYFMGEGGSSLWTEIKTGELALLESGRAIRSSFRDFMMKAIEMSVGRKPTVCMERMLVNQGHLFYVQMILIELMDVWGKEGLVHLPLPVQLRSYIKGVCGKVPENKTEVVEFYHTQSGSPKPRVSSHVAEAYFLARMAASIVQGEYTLKLPVKEHKLVGWQGNGGKRD